MSKTERPYWVEDLRSLAYISHAKASAFAPFIFQGRVTKSASKSHLSDLGQLLPFTGSHSILLDLAIYVLLGPVGISPVPGYPNDPFSSDMEQREAFGPLFTELPLLHHPGGEQDHQIFSCYLRISGATPHIWPLGIETYLTSADDRGIQIFGRAIVV